MIHTRPTFYRISFLVLIALLAFAMGGSYAAAQGSSTVSVYPPELYPGENVLTVAAADGIQQIIVRHTRNLVVEGDGTFSCTPSQKLHVSMLDADRGTALEVEVTDCKGGTTVKRILPNNTSVTWQLDENAFSETEKGDRNCETFRISRDITVEDVILDSISVTDPRISIRLPGSLPARIRPGQVYHYQVCFKADEIGTFKFPVVTWIRRRYPSGGFSNYPVADTGFVNVIPPSIEIADLPDTGIVDPTTFRSVVLPNAIIPPAGSFFVGDYDFLGVVGGYAITKNLMVFVGGLLPTPDDWGSVHGTSTAALGGGVKAGIALTNKLNIAAGYTWGYSDYQEAIRPNQTATVTASVPFGAISYGDDDSRISFTGGYAFKHHKGFDAEFDQNATILSLGGDYRFANHWKVAGEIASIETLGVVPIIATARYFSDTYAIDFGLGYAGITTGNGTAAKIPVFPVLAATFVF